MTAQTKIQKLEAQKKSIDEQIKEARKAEAQREAAQYDERCRIVGFAVLAEMNENTEFSTTLNPVIEARTISPKDRKKLGLPPAKKN